MTEGHLPLVRCLWNGDDLIGYQPHCLCEWVGDPILFQGPNELEVLNKARHSAAGHVLMADARDRLAAGRDKLAGAG